MCTCEGVRVCSSPNRLPQLIELLQHTLHLDMHRHFGSVRSKRAPERRRRQTRFSAHTAMATPPILRSHPTLTGSWPLRSPPGTQRHQSWPRPGWREGLRPLGRSEQTPQGHSYADSTRGRVTCHMEVT